MDLNDGNQHTCTLGDRRHWEAESRSAWIDSRLIFGGSNEVVIKHGDQIYRLRITKLGKLILNK